jgi:hypothetical protein
MPFATMAQREAQREAKVHELGAEDEEIPLVDETRRWEEYERGKMAGKQTRGS